MSQRKTPMFIKRVTATWIVNGNEMRRRRRGRDITMQALADRVGVTASLICQIEHGHKTASDKVRRSISSVLVQGLR